MTDSLFATGIRPTVDQYLLDEAGKVRDYGDYWSASSAGYCMRKLIFERLKVTPTLAPGARKQRVFSVGHIFHAWLQDLTVQAGISVAQEVELQDDELMIRGHFDDLISINGHLILYDYKTQNSRAFTWNKKNGDNMSHFHRHQLLTYIYMLRKMKELVAEDDDGHPIFNVENLSEARILKISKDDLRMHEQQLFWNKANELIITSWWKELNRYWTERKLPPCTCADHEGGFMAKEAYNPYFYKGEPCSLEYYLLWREKKEESMK